MIITIIVMLILVGVTINVALNGGLFTQAQTAANDTQIQADKEQLLSAVVASYDIATETISESELRKNLGDGWTVVKEGSVYKVTSPKGNIFTVDAKGNIDYKGKTTTDSGENPSENENPLKMKIVQAYDMSTKTVELKITPEITNDETAIAIIAETVNMIFPGNNASTLQDVNLILANMALQEDGQEPYSDYSALVTAMAEMLNKDNPTDQEIFATLMDSSDTTLQETGSFLIMEYAEFIINGKTIEEDDENLDRRETGIEYNGITENGEYNIQLKFGDKIASKTITVSTIVTEGTTVVKSAEIEKGYWYDVSSWIIDESLLEQVFCVVAEDIEGTLGMLGMAHTHASDAYIPTLVALCSFEENFEENGITYESAFTQQKALIGSGSGEHTIVGWINEQGNLVFKNSDTNKFIEYEKQQMPNCSENFAKIYDTTLTLDGSLLLGQLYTLSFGLLENGKCQYIYRNEEYGIEMICSNGPVNYRIEDGKLIVEEIENWNYNTYTGGTGTGTYKEYTIVNEFSEETETAEVKIRK